MRTRTIRIGFSVLVLPLFEPIRLAEEIATLDVLSEGRVDVGVSRGNTSRYFEAWGLPYDDRSTAFSATFDNLIRYWTEGKVEVGSRTESIEPKCVQRPHPPVYVVTYREEGAAWVAEHGCTLFQGSQQSVDSLRRCIRAFENAGGDAAKVPVGRFVVVGETDEAARLAARPAAEKLTAGYRRTGEQVKRRISTEDELDTERWMNEVVIIGSPQSVAARITAPPGRTGLREHPTCDWLPGQSSEDECHRNDRTFCQRGETDLAGDAGEERTTSGSRGIMFPANRHLGRVPCNTRGRRKVRMEKVNVGYIVNDVDTVIPFYTGILGFKLEKHPAPGFALLSKGNLQLLLNSPGTGGAGQSMDDGRVPASGGWNRFQIQVDDLAETVAQLEGRRLPLSQ
jgi:hypothetical protein